MAGYATIYHFRGGTKEQYEAGRARVLQDDKLPEGQSYHFAGPSDDGWVVFAVWDSRERWQRFRDETLMPGLQSLGDAGFPSPPEETSFEIQNEQRGE
jgi:hypothetical protein